MDIVYGKTYRRVSNFRYDAGEILIHSNPQMEIIGNKFSPNVSYSTKKRKRWELIPSISKQININGESEYEGDISIRCCVRQKHEGRGSTKAHYLIDSDFQKEIGSMNLSDKKFNKGSFNLDSVIKGFEQPTDQSDKEIHSNSINWTSIADKLLQNSFPSEDSFVSMFNHELLKKDDFARDSAKNKNHIFIEQIVPVNNPYSTKVRLWHPERRRKIAPKKWEFDDFSVNEKNGSAYDLTDDEGNDTVCKELWYDDYNPEQTFSKKQNFVITSKTYQSKKRRRQNKKPCKYSETIDQSLEDFQPLSRPKASECFVINELPHIVITLSNELFMEELKTVSGFCNCWKSSTLPEMILIDVDYLSNLLHKNYIILKPLSINSDTSLAISVIFNLFNYDFSQIINNKFESLLGLVTFVQSTIDQIENFQRSDQTPKILSLSDPIENLLNTWDTEIIETTKSLFCFNAEWKKYEFHENEINIEKLPSSFAEMISVCEICAEPFNEVESFLLKECQHKICGKCFTNHLMGIIKRNLFVFDCPVTECNSTVDCVSVLSLIPFEQYNYVVKCLESSIIKTKDCSQCFSCKSVLVKSAAPLELVMKKFDYFCKCKTIICGLCGNEQHWPASCDDIVQHSRQLVKLNDQYNFQLPKPVKVEGKFCPTCHKFHVHNFSDPYIFCSCNNWFCYYCGKNNCKSSPETICSYDHRRVVLSVNISSHDCDPKPDSIRSKFYCKSINTRFWLQQSKASSLKQQLKQIDNRIKNDVDLDFDRDKIFSQYEQILKVIDSFYVFQYQNTEKCSIKSQILLKSVQNLIWFVNEFRAIIDQLKMSTSKNQKMQISYGEISKKRKKVIACMKDAMDVAKKCHTYIY